MSSSPTDVTLLLVDWGKGSQQALDDLIPLVYNELHRLAARYMSREREGHTLQPTALVNEVYLKLVDQRQVNWQNRAQFFGVAARLMRRILVDHARAHLYAKRGGGARKLTLDEAIDVPAKRDLDLIALDDALASLAEIDPQHSRIVELRFFGGLTIQETAEVLGVSAATVKRGWDWAKTWLYRELKER